MPLATSPQPVASRQPCTPCCPPCMCSMAPDNRWCAASLVLLMVFCLGQAFSNLLLQENVGTLNIQFASSFFDY
jgi:hypothetical protein